MYPILLYIQDIKHFIIAVLINLHLLWLFSQAHFLSCMQVCVLSICVCVYAVTGVVAEHCLFRRVANGSTPGHWLASQQRGYIQGQVKKMQLGAN